MKTHRPGRQFGLTLVETAVTLAIAAILVGAVAPSFNKSIEHRHVEGTAAQVETDLQLARSLAVARNQHVRVSFEESADSTCYVIVTGNAGDCHCSAPGPAVCSHGAESLHTVRVGSESHLHLHSNSHSMVFDPLQGTVTPTATIQVVGQSGAALHEVVNILGRVRSCSPASSVPGYRAC
jgi:type IV fimbrial biogenesis protein FimT